MLKKLAKLFSPKSIAIYGVSRDTTKIASTIFNNLLSSEYEGKIFPINPKYKEIFGYPCYPKAAAIPHRVDLAIMAIPAQFTDVVLKDCKKRGIKNLVIISAGFKESGADGKKLEQDLVKKAEKYDITVLGPNCLGLIVTGSKMNASFSAANAEQGDTAFVSQSGAVCTSMLDLANSRNFGFSHFVSLGNKANLNENDLLEYWLRSEKTKVIGAYLEEFSDGLDFCLLKKRIEIEKPVVVIHPGKTSEAQNAMSSHTGSLAGADATISAALEKNGITRVESLDQAYALMMSYSWGKLPKLSDGVNHVAIVTNAGGPGIIATDKVIESGLKLAVLSEETKAKLRVTLPDSASVGNPVDILGDAMSDRYQSAINGLIDAEEVNSIIVILTPQLVTQIEDTAKLLVNLSKLTEKPILPIFLGGNYAEAGLQRLFDNRIPSFSDMDLAMYSLRKMTDYVNYLTFTASKAKKNNAEFADYRKTRKDNDVSKNTTDELKPLPEEVVQSLLAEFDFNVPKSRVITTLEEAYEFTKENKYPVVIKATTEYVVHKTDFKAVYVNVSSDADLKLKLTELQENIYKRTGKDHPPVLIQQQIKAKEELLLGVTRDGGADVYEKDGRGFGHLIVFGKGGIHTEVYKDISRNLVPLSETEIDKLIDTTLISQVINGVRGSEPLARAKLIETIQKLQSLVVTYPEISQIDFNPVMINEKDCVVVDAKIFVQN